MRRTGSKDYQTQREWVLLVILCFHAIYLSFLIHAQYEFLTTLRDEYSQNTEPEDAFIHAVPTYAVYLTGVIYLGYFVIKKCCIEVEERVGVEVRRSHVTTAGWKQYLAHKAVHIVT